MNLTLTTEQLKEFAAEVLRGAKEEAEQPTAADARRYVYGLRGIRELFHVSHPTAQRYKNTFLAPAVMQRGRKIVVDVEKAMQCYNNNNGL